MGSVFSEPWEKHVYRHSVDNVAHATIYCVTTFKGAVYKSFSCKYKSGLKMINRSWFWGYADVLCKGDVSYHSHIPIQRSCASGQSTYTPPVPLAHRTNS